MHVEQGKTQWGRVFLLVGAGVIASFQIGKAPPALPAMREELGMDLFMAGWILSTFNIIGLLFGSVSGAFADAFGRRRLLLPALAAQAAGSLAGAWAHGPMFLFATRVVEGLGFLGVAVSAPAVIFRITHPSHLRIALALWSCFVPAGVAAIMVLTPLILPTFGWRGLWRFNAAVLILYLALLAFTFRGGRSEARPAGFSWPRIFKDVWSTSTAIGPVLLTATFATYTVQWLAVMGFLPTLLVDGDAMTPGRASLLTALVVVLNVPGNLAGGWLLTRGIARWKIIFAACLLLAGAAPLIYGAELPFGLRYGGALFFSGTGGLVAAAVFAGVPVFAPGPDQVATTNGLVMQGSQLGQFIGPLGLAAVVSLGGGWYAAPWFLASVALLGAALSVWIGRLECTRYRSAGL